MGRPDSGRYNRFVVCMVYEAGRVKSRQQKKNRKGSGYCRIEGVLCAIKTLMSIIHYIHEEGAAFGGRFLLS